MFHVFHPLVLIINIVFGFAASEALKSVKSTNAGLRDQRAAFECEYLTCTGNLAC